MYPDYFLGISIDTFESRVSCCDLSGSILESSSSSCFLYSSLVKPAFTCTVEAALDQILSIISSSTEFYPFLFEKETALSHYMSFLWYVSNLELPWRVSLKSEASKSSVSSGTKPRPNDLSILPEYSWNDVYFVASGEFWLI